MYQIRKLMTIFALLVGVLGGVSEAKSDFHVWTPDNITHTALTYPANVAVAPDGSIYVLLQSNVKKLDSNGHLLLEWGSYGNGDGDGEFAFPAGITVDGSGNVYVADTYNNRIQKFDSSGNFLSKWGTNIRRDSYLESQ